MTTAYIKYIKLFYVDIFDHIWHLYFSSLGCQYAEFSMSHMQLRCDMLLKATISVASWNPQLRGQLKWLANCYIGQTLANTFYYLLTTPDLQDFSWFFNILVFFSACLLHWSSSQTTKRKHICPYLSYFTRDVNPIACLYSLSKVRASDRMLIQHHGIPSNTWSLSSALTEHRRTIEVQRIYGNLVLSSYVYIYIHMYIYIYKCTYMYIYINICTHLCI